MIKSLPQVLLNLTHLDYWIEPCGTNLIFSHLMFSDKTALGISEQLFVWDLTKETLEEQSGETQRVINELLLSKND